MNKKILVGNMKMNLTLSEVKDYITKMSLYKDFIICPSYIYIPNFLDAGFQTGSQDVSMYDKGAYTGEISSQQLKSMGVEYTIIGHSERRSYFHETNLVINQKIKEALSNNLKVILCVGETLGDYENKCTEEIITKQLCEGLDNIKGINSENLIVAYEPIWAIGTGKIPDNQEIENVISVIKNFINKHYYFYPKVLYGGSINEQNISDLNSINNADGFLVGGACLVPDKFIKIIETIK